jgi:Zn-dependent alcohol dehydrogenase
VIVGLGGVGANAVQGAVHAGALHVIGVDPVAMKREFAESLGATRTVAGSDEAADLARRLSRGTGADVVIVTVGKLTAEAYAGAVACLGKAGTIVLTALPDEPQDGRLTVNGPMTTVYEQRIQGSLYGSCNPRTDIPRLLQMHEEGRLELDRLITRRYSLDELNQGYRDQAAGEIVRGLLVHAD